MNDRQKTTYSPDLVARQGCSNQNPSLQRSTRTDLETQNSGAVPSIVHEVLRSPGQPLDGQTRAFMEPRFGHDFSQVRVHTDARAADSARVVNALAYTVGRDVVFGTGQYRPDSAKGRSLLAHELTHTIQQDNGSGRSVLRASGIGDAAEQEAERASQVINEGGSFQSLRKGEPLLARQIEAGYPDGVPTPSPRPTPTAGKTHSFSITMEGCDKAPFEAAKVKAEARWAFDTVKNTDCIKSASLKDEILGRFNGLKIECEHGEDSCVSVPDTCGCTYMLFSNTINLYKIALEQRCGMLASTILHEVMHLWSPARSHDVIHGCEKSCFDFGRGSGDAANCK